MNKSRGVSRRNFLKIAGINMLAVYTSGQHGYLFEDWTRMQRQLQTNEPDVEVSLDAVVTETQVLPGRSTTVWSYRGTVIQGEASVLQSLPGSYLGPTFRVKQGQHVRIHFNNRLPEPSIVHWHGLRLPEEMDAHPRFAVSSGETYTYDFQVLNRAGTYWYHPHPDMLTGWQVYNGLAGLFIVTDDEEAAAGLPEGEYDIPLVIQDRTIDTDNQFVYIAEDMRSATMGFLGDRILVNGQPDAALSERLELSYLQIGMER
jgi:hypothetical protein